MPLGFTRRFFIQGAFPNLCHIQFLIIYSVSYPLPSHATYSPPSHSPSLSLSLSLTQIMSSLLSPLSLSLSLSLSPPSFLLRILTLSLSLTFYYTYLSTLLFLPPYPSLFPLQSLPFYP